MKYLRNFLQILRNAPVRVIWYFRTKFTNHFLKTATLVLVGSFIGAVLTLTIKNVGEPIKDYSELYSVVLGTTGTVVAIFFSLVLIPLNRISERYSPRFLTHLKNDHVFITSFLYSVSSITYILYFWIVGGSTYIAIAAALQLIFLFIVLFWLWKRSIFLSNPRNSVLLPEQARILKNTKIGIKHTTKRTKKMMGKISGGVDSASTEHYAYFKVDDSVTNYVKTSLLPFREVALKSIRNGELEQAQNAISAITAVTVSYLHLRREYYNDEDPLMYFVYTEFKLLIEESGTKELKIRLHPFIVECWKQIALQAAVVKVNKMARMTNGLNLLVTYPIKSLKEMFILNLSEDDATTPGDIAKAMGDIGVTLMQDGYDHQASSLIKDMATLSKIANSAGVGVFSGSLNYNLMRIYTVGLAYRNKQAPDGHNIVFDEINKSIRELMDTLLQKKLSTFDNMVVGSFIGWLNDPINGINLSRVSEYALFNEGLSEESIGLNMQSVAWNIEYIDRAIKSLAVHKDRYFTEQAYENLYQTMLVILSYICDEMAKSHITYYKDEPVKSPDLVNEAKNLLYKCVDILIADIDDATATISARFGCLDVLASIYFVILHESKKNKHKELDDVYRNVHAKLVDGANRYTNNGTSNSNSDQTKYLRLIRDVLKANKYYARSSELKIPDYQYDSSHFGMLYDNEYPSQMVGRGWHLTRPIYQRDGGYYGDVEASLNISL